MTRLLSNLNTSVSKVTSVDPNDPSVLVGSTLLLAVLALLACYLPARKSTAIDPAITLRQE